MTCLLLAVFLLSVGCGGGDDGAGSQDFAASYNRTIERLTHVNAQLAQLQSSSRARSRTAIGREFDQFGDALADTRADLSRLEPPDRAARQFRALLAALDRSIAASRRAAAAARAIQPARQRRAVRELRRASRDVDSAQDALGRAVARG
jgi:hypothetical protein